MILHKTNFNVTGFPNNKTSNIIAHIEYVIFIKVKNRYYTYDKEDKGKYIILKGNEMEVKI